MRRHAFTLTEILAVLAGVMLPVFRTVRGRARHTACADRLRQLGIADALYAGDHDAWLPPATTTESTYVRVPGTASSEVLASPAVLRASLRPYVKDEAVWFCPADPQAGRDVLWLGQRHLLTSYRFMVGGAENLEEWPPRMQLGRAPSALKPDGAMDFPLLSDAACVAACDRLPPYPADDPGESNHLDGIANVLRQDLSLARVSTAELMKPWTTVSP